MTSEEEIFKVYEFTHKYEIIQGLEEFTECKKTELFKDGIAFLMEILMKKDGGIIDIYNSSDPENSTIEIRMNADEDSAFAYFKIKRIYCIPDDNKNVYAQLTCNGKPADPAFLLNEWLEKENDDEYVMKNMIKLIKVIQNNDIKNHQDI